MPDEQCAAGVSLTVICRARFDCASFGSRVIKYCI